MPTSDPLNVPPGFPSPPPEFLAAIGSDLLARFCDPNQETEPQDVRLLEQRLDRFAGTLARRARVLERQAEMLYDDLDPSKQIR